MRCFVLGCGASYVFNLCVNYLDGPVFPSFVIRADLHQRLLKATSAALPSPLESRTFGF